MASLAVFGKCLYLLTKRVLCFQTTLEFLHIFKLLYSKIISHFLLYISFIIRHVVETAEWTVLLRFEHHMVIDLVHSSCTPILHFLFTVGCQIAAPRPQVQSFILIKAIRQQVSVFRQPFAEDNHSPVGSVAPICPWMK